MHVPGSTPEQVGKVRPVADESAGHHALLRLEHPRQSVLRQKFDDAADVKLVERIVAHQHGIGPLAHYRSKGGLEISDSADFDWNQHHASCRSRNLIPNPIDQNPWAHWHSPMDMMRQG